MQEQGAIQVLDAETLCRILHCSRRYLRELVRSGKLVTLARRGIYCLPADVQRYLDGARRQTVVVNDQHIRVHPDDIPPTAFTQQQIRKLYPEVRDILNRQEA